MIRPRFIPVLLLKKNGLYKTVKFRNETYIGDPVNAVRIFNEKAANEIILLDIDAHKRGDGPNFSLIKDIASEAFIPLCYGGGISSLTQIETLFKIGIEKVSINSAVTHDLSLVTQAARVFGSQSIVVGLDFRKNFFGGYERHTASATINTKEKPAHIAKLAEDAGAGELLVHCIDRDGTMQGYDLDLVRVVADAVQIPVIACGGAADLADMATAITSGHAASAAAGSIFVFRGKHRAVLITYPDEEQIETAFSSQ